MISFKSFLAEELADVVKVSSGHTDVFADIYKNPTRAEFQKLGLVQGICPFAAWIWPGHCMAWDRELLSHLEVKREMRGRIPDGSLPVYVEYDMTRKTMVTRVAGWSHPSDHVRAGTIRDLFASIPTFTGLTFRVPHGGPRF